MNPSLTNLLAAQQSQIQQQTMYNPIFGNTMFSVTAPENGQLLNGFPQIPYFSIEAASQQQQISPTNVRTGNTAGAQTIQGTYNVTDNSGTTRMVMGYSPGSF